ncbi:hypothetical protein SAVIM40S_02280 [Streptomyces avidinii]
MAPTRVRVRCAPSARAVSSPMAIALSGRPSASASTAPTSRKGATCRTVSMLAEASEPTVQKRSLSRALVSISCTALMYPTRAALAAVPASARRTGVALRLPPSM